MKNWETIKNDAKQKYHEVKRDIKYNTRCTIDWIKNNPEAAVAISTFGIAAIKGTMKIVDKIDAKAKVDKLQDLKDRYIYDRSLGTYLEMNRIPKANEYIEIEHRKRNGEPLTAILRSMRLI